MNESEKEVRLTEIRDDIKDYVISVNTRKTSKWLFDIETNLNQLVVGQERAVGHMIRRLGIFYSGLKDPRRPIGSMIFLGPTGTGKTYAAKKLAGELLGYEDGEGDPATIIECANLRAPHSIQTLTGAPPSYIGYGDPPVLSQANIERAHLTQIIRKHYRGELKRLTEMAMSEADLKRAQARAYVENVIREYHKPISVIVFDEIEEAHSNIIGLLLNIFEEGRTTLADGSITDFSRSIFILTSNVGSQEIKKLHDGGLGFHLPHQSRQGEGIDKDIYEISKRALEKNPKFPPKFIGRLRGDIIVFRSLTRTHFSRILDLMLAEIQRRLSGKSVDSPLLLVSYSRSFKDFLIAEGVDPEYGARNLRAVVEKRVTYQIGQAISSGELRVGDKVLFRIENGEPVLRRRPRPKGVKLPEFQRQFNGRKVDIESVIRTRFGLPPRKPSSPPSKS